MVTGDVILEAFLVEMFYNESGNPEIEGQPDNVHHPRTRKLFLPC